MGLPRYLTNRSESEMGITLTKTEDLHLCQYIRDESNKIIHKTIKQIIMKKEYYKSENQLDTLDQMLLEDGWMATAYFISGNIRKYHDRLGKKKCKSSKSLYSIYEVLDDRFSRTRYKAEKLFLKDLKLEVITDVLEATDQKIQSDYKKAIEYNKRLQCIMNDLSGEDYEFCGMLFDRNHKLLMKMKEKLSNY